jgi:cytosine/adenosine deaminase-related metal-dependent hydrolase
MKTSVRQAGEPQLKKTSRRKFLRFLPAIAVIGFPLLLCAIAQQASSARTDYDLVILNGRVMDPETDLDAIRNVGIRDGKIEAVTSEMLQGRTALDARGLVVSPGFIDLHQHGQDAENDAVKAADGVTTALELEVGVDDVDAWYTARAKNALINFGASVGHIRVRMAVMRDRGRLLPSGEAAHRAASGDELQQIEAGIEKGLKRGALAVGLGPAYTPGATNLEVLKAFEIAARHNASVHVHIRGSGQDPDGTFGGFQEVLADAAATGAALHVAHIQSTSGPNVIHELDMIRGARTRGLDVTTEAYPYNRGMTEIQSALYNNRENEPDSFFASLLWPATGENLTRESFLRYRKTGGLVIRAATTPELVRAAILDPLTMIASDGFLEGGRGHPRTAGTYARVLGQYVREERALPLMDALRKMTLMPAQRLEKRVPAMRDKGRLRVGADADITVFDLATVRDTSTYTEPALQSLGMRYVLVNGVVVVADGKVQAGVAAGREIRAPLQ